MFLSIVIPVYNGAKYLDAIMNSIYCQNVSEDEFEVILVDDFSTDDSRDVIDRIASRHKNIKTLFHPSNKGVATTCNDGVDVAEGDYFWIIGQDDSISSNSLVRLALESRNNTDVLLFNYQHVDEKGAFNGDNLIFNNFMGGGIELIVNTFGDNFHYYLLGFEWRAIFRRKYVNSIGLRFPDGHRFEDTTYLMKALVYSNNVKAIEDTLYHYQDRRGSIMNRLEHFKDGCLIYDFAFVNGKEVEEFANKIRNIDQRMSSILDQKATWYYNSFRKDLLLTKKREKKRFFDMIRKKPIECSNRLSILNRILLINASFGFQLSLLLTPAYKFWRKLKCSCR